MREKAKASAKGWHGGASKMLTKVKLNAILLQLLLATPGVVQLSCNAGMDYHYHGCFSVFCKETTYHWCSPAVQASLASRRLYLVDILCACMNLGCVFQHISDWEWPVFLRRRMFFRSRMMTQRWQCGAGGAARCLGGGRL